MPEIFPESVRQNQKVEIFPPIENTGKTRDKVAQQTGIGRRNLTEEQKAYLRGKRYENEKLKGTTLNQHTKSAGGQNVPQQKTAEKLATEYGVSDKTIKHGGDRKKESNPQNEGKLKFVKKLLKFRKF